ncbi:hypothetical protein PVL29_021148 [Vitis rotundifolia]|uniref:Glycosyltransferase n=1 Tax=Vitis rotundifolia TaxID=103349 RepID=A0AA38YYN0_VITRO|nr:hypothetical protein PVL29_021148 [Vitis rotundifolia]
MESSKPHAVLLASPGLGHLIPVLELAKRLVTHHGFHVTVFAITASASPAESQPLRSAASSKLLHVVELPSADISSLVDADAAVVTRIVVMMRETIPRFRAAISAMKVPPSLMIVDLFGFEALEIPEFDMPKYTYVPSTAWFLALTLYVPTLDVEVKGEYVDRAEPLQLPGCKPVRPEDVVDPMLERRNQQYLEYMRMGVGITKADGILSNTWEDLEPTTLKALRDHKAMAQFAKVPIYPVGPLTRPVGKEEARGELLDWLDLQPADSVIYVSFGSGGTHSSEQLAELAWGLELSQQRFIWVVRPPIENDPSGSFFTTGKGGEHPSDYLPEGFLTRTKNVGVVVPLWAPQVEILSHPSVGGFLSHCGWGSTLESILSGVPMVAWPLYSEQRLNATMLTEELGIAVRPEVLPTKRVVMEENHLRERAKEVMKSGERALRKGGSSYNSLSRVASAAISFHKSTGAP